MDNIGGFANYKGVMLCSRPEDKSNKVIDRPFCSMVKHDNDLGINPDKPQKRRVRKSKKEFKFRGPPGARKPQEVAQVPQGGDQG